MSGYTLAMKMAWLALLTLAAVSVPMAAWEVPPDNGTMGTDAVAAILAGSDYPETSSYKQAVELSTRHVDAETRALWWKAAQRSPR